MQIMHIKKPAVCKQPGDLIHLSTDSFPAGDITVSHNTQVP